MKLFAKILIHIIFLTTFVLALILGTMVFRLMNKTFLFESFETHGVYENLPKAMALALPNDPKLDAETSSGVAAVLNQMSPELFKSILETNLSQILDFLNGESTDVALRLPAVELAITGMTKDIKWSLSENAPPDIRQEYIAAVGKIRMFVGIAWAALGGALLMLTILYSLLSKPKILRGDSTLLIPSGLLATSIGILGKVLISLIAGADMTGREPSEVLLFQFTNSLLPGITSFWLTIGIPMLTAALLVQIYIRLPHKKPAWMS